MSRSTDIEPLSRSRIDEVVRLIAPMNKSAISSDLDRRLLLTEAQKLVTRLQTPLEQTTTICHTDTFILAAMKALVEMSLFDRWERDGGSPRTSKQLAQLVGAELSLLGMEDFCCVIRVLTDALMFLLERLLRVVTAAGLLCAADKDGNNDTLYLFTDFAKGTASGKLWHYWYYHTLVLAHCTAALPEHLKGTNFREPTSAIDSPWATQKGKPFMDWAQGNPEIFTHLNEVMAFKSQDNIPWFRTFPAQDFIRKTEGPVLVDIGGGMGHDLKRFYDTFGSALRPGQLVLQDVAQAIEEAGQLPPVIQKQTYDFFTEQPVKGARMYYLHNVLHDWSDEECLTILARVKEAMKPGYSKLLINEFVLSLQSTPFACATDVAMMVINSGAERTADQWRELLRKAGLRVQEMYLPTGVDEGLIEVEI